MNYKELKGRYFGNDTFSKKLDSDMWEVIVVIKERVSEDGVNWVEESIGTTAVDADFDTAHKMALRVVLQELDRLVYQKGFDSLVQGIEADRLLEKEGKNESNADNNKDTYIQ